MKDWQGIKDDWKRANLDLFGNEYPFATDREECHAKDD